MAPGPSPIGYAGMRMNADDYLDLGETFEWYELIDGVVLEHERRSILHQDLLFAVLDQTHGRNDLKALHSTDVRLSDAHVYCPDVLIYRTERFAKSPKRLTTPPDLIVEICTSYSHSLDRFTKRDDYQRFGVGEYWILIQRPSPGAQFTRTSVSDPTLASNALKAFMLDLGPLRDLIETDRAELSNQK